jgi:hypothetical protein
MFRRSLPIALAALALLTVAAAGAQAPVTLPRPKPKSDNLGKLTSSVYYRTRGKTDWQLFGVYRSEGSARGVFRHLARSGYQVELRISNAPIPRTPQRKATGLLPPSETVTLTKAKEVFNWMARQKDIAFRFPTDGCYARAHLMIRRMQRNGFRPRKVWAFANGDTLYARTRNHPDGHVTWGYHVAPVLRVRIDSKTQRWYVIDPSLFQGPATVGQWEAAMKKNKNSHRPYLTLTQPGVPPTLLSKRKSAGSGYWPAADPKEGVDAHAVAIMRKYKPYEGKRPPKGLVLLPNPGGPGWVVALAARPEAVLRRRGMLAA